jgi:plastocyanin
MLNPGGPATQGMVLGLFHQNPFDFSGHHYKVPAPVRPEISNKPVAMKKKFLRILPFLLCLTLAARAAVHTVQVEDFKFSPATLNVNVGDTIRWVWVEGFHTTTSTMIPVGAPTWNSPITSANPTFSYRVMMAGTYNYVCTPHAPNMAGSFTASLTTSLEEQAREPFFRLNGNVASDQISVELNLQQNSEVNIRLFNMVGRAVRTFAASRRGAGTYNESYFVGDLPKGIYLLAVVADNQRVTRRVIVE